MIWLKFITNNLKMTNPYGSTLINKTPCTQGSISISNPSKGNYSISFYSVPQKKIITTNMGTTWTPVKVGKNTKYTKVDTNLDRIKIKQKFPLSSFFRASM